MSPFSNGIKTIVKRHSFLSPEHFNDDNIDAL
jgi:hypothetical protein